MLVSYPDVDFPSAQIRRDVACPLGECAGEPSACFWAGSLDCGAARLASGPCCAACQAGSSAQRFASGGLECSTVRVRRARACADNPRHHAWFPNNVARNSLVTISDFENASLELQRLWGVSKTDRHKLRATFGGGEGRGGKRISGTLARDRRQPRAPAEAPATVADHVRTSYPRTNSARAGEASHCLVPKEDTDTPATADAK